MWEARHDGFGNIVANSLVGHAASIELTEALDSPLCLKPPEAICACSG